MKTIAAAIFAALSLAVNQAGAQSIGDFERDGRYWIQYSFADQKTLLSLGIPSVELFIAKSERPGCPSAAFEPALTSCPMDSVRAIGPFATQDKAMRFAKTNKFNGNNIKILKLRDAADSEVFRSLADQNQEIADRKTAAKNIEDQRAAAEHAMLAKEETDRQEVISKQEAYYNSLRKDTVSKVLNYSTGLEDEGASDDSWYVSPGAKCTYIRVQGPTHEIVSKINLNQYDARNFKFKTEYVYVLNEWTLQKQLMKVSQIYYMEKLLLGADHPLDLDRLERGWGLIYSKYCGGTRKEF